MTKGDLAYDNFLKEYNCSQAVAVAFADELGVDEKTVALLASGFGGGVGRLREVCGTFSGIVMVISGLYGYSNHEESYKKKELYEKIQNLASQFKSDNGSIICRELLGLRKGDVSPIPEARTPEYYQKRPCPELCRYAANLLEQFIKDNPPDID